MKTLTIKEFVADQESILRRVEKGEKIAVTDGEVSAVLVPSDEYVYGMNNNEVLITSKSSKKLGFFEKFFQLFS